MSMKNKVIITMMVCLIFSFINILIVPATSYACSCVPPQSVENELGRSKVVFSGEVIQVKEQKDYFKGYMTKKVLFEVTKTWKGLSQSQVIITTGTGGGDCGYDFQTGKEYVVYAQMSSMYGDKDELVTIVCSRTNELSAAQEDLAYLGEGEVPTEKVDLTAAIPKGVNPIIWIGTTILIGTIIFLVWRRFKK
jgi:hypothetical protein